MGRHSPPNCRSAKNCTDQDQAIQGQQPATQVVVTGIEENDVASDCSEEYIEDSVEKFEEDASTLHCIRRNTI